MKLTVTHTLIVPLGAPSRAVEHVLLTPSNTPQQKLEHWSIEMPGFDHAAAFRDGYGNRAHLVSQSKPGDSIIVSVAGSAETTDRAGVLGRLDYEPPAALYLRPSPHAVADETLIAGLPQGGRIALLHELMDRVHARTAPSQSQSAEGQSQNSGTTDATPLAHAFIGAARAIGIPARYATGYRAGSDALHAWAEAWDDRLGWIGFDPLLNLCPAETHLRLATALDAPTATPLRIVPPPAGEIAQTVVVVAG